MSTNQAERPRFYEGQYLGAKDLMAAISYGRIQHARHLLGAHTWGIAMGLQLKEVPSPAGDGQVEVYLSPGYAWDGFGRPVVVLAPYSIPAEKFKSYVYDAAIDGGDPEGRLIEVWLRYDELETQSPRPGFEVCDTVDQYARVRETFRLEVGERRTHSERHDPISVAGHTVDAQEALQVLDSNDPFIYDESIPHQALPEEDENARWLIPLGYVRWKPSPNPTQPGHFVEMTDDDREQSRRIRRYIGVVAEGIQAADGLIRLRDRTKDPFAPVWSDDLVWVEGDLRVDADIKLFGGKLDFRDNAGNPRDDEDGGVPFVIRRIEDNGLGGKDLQVVLGQKEDGNNRLVIGPTVNGGLRGRLVVRDDGNVGIGTTTPGAKLEVHAGDLLLKASGDDPGDLIFRDSDGNQKGRIWSKPAAGAALHLSSGDNTPDITIAANGNVGIGTIGPTGRLDVRGNIKLGTDGALFAIGALDNLRVIAGRVDASGNEVTGSGYTANRTDTGTYSVTFEDPFDVAPVVLASPVNAPVDDNIVTIRNVGVNGFEVRSVDVEGAASGDLQNTSFTFIALGVRA